MTRPDPAKIEKAFLDYHNEPLRTPGEIDFGERMADKTEDGHWYNSACEFYQGYLAGWRERGKACAVEE